MKSYPFVKSLKGNKITLVPGYRLVKGTRGKYEVRRKKVIVANVYCKCRGGGSGCGFKSNSCVQSESCKQNCLIVIEEV